MMTIMSIEASFPINLKNLLNYSLDDQRMDQNENRIISNFIETRLLK